MELFWRLNKIMYKAKAVGGTSGYWIILNNPRLHTPSPIKRGQKEADGEGSDSSVSSKAAAGDCGFSCEPIAP